MTEIEVTMLPCYICGDYHDPIHHGDPIFILSPSLYTSTEFTGRILDTASSLATGFDEAAKKIRKLKGEYENLNLDLTEEDDAFQYAHEIGTEAEDVIGEIGYIVLNRDPNSWIIYKEVDGSS